MQWGRMSIWIMQVSVVAVAIVPHRHLLHRRQRHAGLQYINPLVPIPTATKAKDYH